MISSILLCNSTTSKLMMSLNQTPFMEKIHGCDKKSMLTSQEIEQPLGDVEKEDIRRESDSKVLSFSLSHSFSLFQPIPTCPTIQAQMDPEIIFNPLFVTHHFESYVQASGSYFNEIVPIGSNVNLTCFFPGIYNSVTLKSWFLYNANKQYLTS